MALVEPIRFRKLDKELTDDEFFNPFCKSIGRKMIASALSDYFASKSDEKFFNSLCKSIGRDMIASSLFVHFKNDSNKAYSATKIQSNVMNKREIIPDQPRSYDCIDQLPPKLISECVSWLCCSEYLRFGQCNRTIYYSCYSPSKIQEFYWYGVPEDYSSPIDLTPFKNIHTLTMEIGQYDESPFSNEWVWKNNKSLKVLDLSNDEGNEEDEESFAQDLHMINKENVRYLSLRCFSWDDPVLKIISRFDQI